MICFYIKLYCGLLFSPHFILPWCFFVFTCLAKVFNPNGHHHHILEDNYSTNIGTIQVYRSSEENPGRTLFSHYNLSRCPASLLHFLTTRNSMDFSNLYRSRDRHPDLISCKTCCKFVIYRKCKHTTND